MNIAIISYSFSGNNDALASSLAKELAATHIQISEPKPRTMGTIVLDMIFNRTPRIQQIPDITGKNDLTIFIGPVWMGQVAAPLRSCLRNLKKNPCKYAFISISGGADAGNLKLEGDLIKRTGIKPESLIDLHIADLLPKDSTPGRKDTSAYHINSADIEKLKAEILNQLHL